MAFREMKLLKERKIAELIAPPKGSGVLEASGVFAKGADFYVIFDNIRRVARIGSSLAPGSPRHGWFGLRRSGDGYEDIAYSPPLKRFFLLIEAADPRFDRSGTERFLADLKPVGVSEVAP